MKRRGKPERKKKPPLTKKHDLAYFVKYAEPKGWLYRVYAMRGGEVRECYGTFITKPEPDEGEIQRGISKAVFPFIDPGEIRRVHEIV